MGCIFLKSELNANVSISKHHSEQDRRDNSGLNLTITDELFGVLT